MTPPAPTDPTEPVIDHAVDNELVAPEIEIQEEAAQTLSPPTTETTTASTPDPAATPQDGVAAAASQAATSAQALETPAWAPTFKYKVREKEHEIDEWARPFIKDEDTQKKFVDLYTRGHGLELAKQEREGIQTKYDNLEQSLGYMSQIVQGYYKDPTKGAQAAGQFIDALGLPKQMFMQYALSELKYQELTPEQRVDVDTQRQQHSDFQQLQVQNQQLTQHNESIAVGQRTLELNTALADPGVQHVAQEYDTMIGRQGAFYNLVVERGVYHDKINGTDVPVTQAIQETMSMLGKSIQPGTAIPQPQTGQVGTPPVQQIMQNPPVLPNVQGQGTASPVKRVVGSIEDIRRRHAELTAQG